jgi:ferredoxin
MALKIVASSCTTCGACEFECPNAAISMIGDVYAISAKKCTECDGDAPKCKSVCPVDDCIVQA